MYTNPMSKKYSVAAARAALPRILDEVESGNEIELTRRGKPVAVVVSVGQFERISAGRRDFGRAYAAYRSRHEGVDRAVVENLRTTEGGRKVSL